MCDQPLVLMWVRLWYSIFEVQFEVLAAQGAFSVVLDQGKQAGKVQVWRQVEVHVGPV